MVKAFRPSLEPPADRQIKPNTGARPLLCLLICAGVAVLVFCAFATSGWNVYKKRFDQNRLHFSYGDEAAVSDVTCDFSSFFCDSYEVKLWEPGKVYLLPSHAEVNKSFIGREESISMLQVPGLAYRELSLYLLDQSELSVSACRQNGSRDFPGEILLFKGEANLRAWRRNKRCASCVERQVCIPLDVRCREEDGTDADGSSEELKFFNDDDTPLSPNAGAQPMDKGINVGRDDDVITHSQYQSLQVTNNATQNSTTASNLFPSPRHATLNHIVSGNDRYFLIIFYGIPRGPESLFTQPGVELWGTVRRTSFDVKGAKKVCVVSGTTPNSLTQMGEANSSSGNSCKFDLPWQSSMDVVVQFEESPVNEYDRRFGGVEDNTNGSVEPGTGMEIEYRVPHHKRDHDGMITKCHVRLSVWICLFGVLPVILMLILSGGVGFLVCRRRTQHFRARWKKSHRQGSKKKHRAKSGDGGDGLVVAEVLPEGAQGSMAIQGD